MVVHNLLLPFDVWLMNHVCLTERLPFFYFVLLLAYFCHFASVIWLFVPVMVLAFSYFLCPCLYSCCSRPCLHTASLSFFLNAALWHLFIPLHFLSACPINLLVCLCPIFPYLPAVILCFVSFICGSHQTLAPDWFSCEQGCSGGPGTSSPGFEAPSHPVHCLLVPPTYKQKMHTLFPLPTLFLLKIKRIYMIFTFSCQSQTNPLSEFLVVIELSIKSVQFLIFIKIYLAAEQCARNKGCAFVQGVHVSYTHILWQQEANASP